MGSDSLSNTHVCMFNYVQTLDTDVQTLDTRVLTTTIGYVDKEKVQTSTVRSCLVLIEGILEPITLLSALHEWPNSKTP